MKTLNVVNVKINDKDRKHLRLQDGDWPIIDEVLLDDFLYYICLDDYGQSYFIVYIDSNDKIQEVSCGSYCGYEDTLEYLHEVNLKERKKKENE